MALILTGKSRCKLCGDVLQTDDEIRGFPHFLPPDHPFGKLSDAAVHLRCFAELPDRAVVEELLARFRRPTDSELAQRELDLFAGNEARTEAWMLLHRELARRADGDEPLKRALFIQWCAAAESIEVSGIGELDSASVRAVLNETARRLARPNPDMHDVELRYMVAWYLREYTPASWDLAPPPIDGELNGPPCSMIDKTVGRGLMGHYWATLCGECDETTVSGSQESQAAAFLQTARILDGVERGPRLDGRAHKGLALMLPLAEASRVDATPGEVGIRRGIGERRSTMHVELLPAVLGHLMERAGLERVADSVVCRLPAGRFLSGLQPERTMWIVLGDDELTIYFASAKLVSPPAEPLSPFDRSRFPVPELRATVPWTPEPRVYEELTGSCPHCATIADQWRKIAGGTTRAEAAGVRSPAPRLRIRANRADVGGQPSKTASSDGAVAARRSQVSSWSASRCSRIRASSSAWTTNPRARITTSSARAPPRTRPSSRPRAKYFRANSLWYS